VGAKLSVFKCVKAVSALEDLAGAGVERELLRKLLEAVEELCDDHFLEYPQLLDQLRALRERLTR
jgi:hypothetical protein